jgi:hypothetical protein
MKKNRLVGIIIGVFTVVVILVLIVSFALNAAAPGLTSPIASSTSRPASTNTPDPCSPQNLQVSVPDLDKLMRQFDDSIQIAQNTPGDQLVPIITDLQAVRRSSQDFTAPDCMENLKQLQLSYMNTYINTLLALYNNYSDMATAKPYVAIATAYSATATPPPVVLQYLALFNQDAVMINQGISQANGYHNQYEAEKARLMGVTLTPSSDQIFPVVTATVVATGTP